MEILADKIETIFTHPSGFQSGLGIVETGYVAGGLSALFSLGFELMGKVAREFVLDSQIIASASCSREFGDTALSLAKFVPLIPEIDREDALTFSGRIDDRTAGGMIAEGGCHQVLNFVVQQLCPFLEVSISHYFSRCADWSDSAFRKALSNAHHITIEAKEILNLNFNNVVNLGPVRGVYFDRMVHLLTQSD